MNKPTTFVSVLILAFAITQGSAVMVAIALLMYFLGSLSARP